MGHAAVVGLSSFAAFKGVIMRTEVLEFIKRRFSKDCDWTNGNCWWFASILCERFAAVGAERWYCPVEGHFVTMIDGVFYDANGIFIPLKEEKPQRWKDLILDDATYAMRLVRDCMQ